MIVTFAIVSGCIGIRLRTICRIRHSHKCDSIYNLRLCKFAPLQGRIQKLQSNFFITRLSPNPSASSRAWLDAIAKYTEYKTKFCAMGVFRSQTPRACECSPLLPLHPNPAFSLTTIYRSVPRSRPTRRREKFTIESSGAFPPFPDTPALPFLFLPRLEQSYILYINPSFPSSSVTIVTIFSIPYPIPKIPSHIVTLTLLQAPALSFVRYVLCYLHNGCHNSQTTALLQCLASL